MAILHRGPQAGTVLLAWRAERERVLGALAAAGANGLVGPCDEGWTVARVLVERDRVVEPAHRLSHVLLEDVARELDVLAATVYVADDGARLLVVHSAAADPLPAVVPGTSGSLDRAEWARLLEALGSADRLEAVLTAAATAQVHPASYARPLAVATAAGLPGLLLEPRLEAGLAPIGEAAWCRGSVDADVLLVASSTGLPVRSAATGTGTVLTVEASADVAVAPVAAALSSSKRPVLVLWRQGPARGYALFSKGDSVDSHSWPAAWELVPQHPDLDPEAGADIRRHLAGEGDAGLLVDLLGRPEVDPVHLRALLRRPSGPEVLDEFAGLLGLPSEMVDLVERGAPAGNLAGSTVVEPTTSLRAISRTAFQPRPDDPWIVRVEYAKPLWYRLSNLAWVPVGGWLGYLAWDGGAGSKALGVLAAGTALGSLVSAVRPGKQLAAAPSD